MQQPLQYKYFDFSNQISKSILLSSRNNQKTEKLPVYMIVNRYSYFKYTSFNIYRSVHNDNFDTYSF